MITLKPPFKEFGDLMAVKNTCKEVQANSVFIFTATYFTD